MEADCIKGVLSNTIGAIESKVGLVLAPPLMLTFLDEVLGSTRYGLSRLFVAAERKSGEANNMLSFLNASAATTSRLLVSKYNKKTSSRGLRNIFMGNAIVE